MNLVPRTHIMNLIMLEYLQSYGREGEKGDFLRFASQPF